MLIELVVGTVAEWRLEWTLGAKAKQLTREGRTRELCAVRTWQWIIMSRIREWIQKRRIMIDGGGYE